MRRPGRRTALRSSSRASRFDILPSVSSKFQLSHVDVASQWSKQKYFISADQKPRIASVTPYLNTSRNLTLLRCIIFSTMKETGFIDPLAPTLSSSEPETFHLVFYIISFIFKLPPRNYSEDPKIRAFPVFTLVDAIIEVNVHCSSRTVRPPSSSRRSRGWRARPRPTTERPSSSSSSSGNSRSTLSVSY